MSAPDLSTPLARRRAWLAQAGGVFRATRTIHARPASVRKGLALGLGLQALFLLILALAATSATTGIELPLVEVVEGVALLLLGCLLLYAISACESDVLREVEQGTLDALTASPLPASAFVAGKLAYLQYVAAAGFLCLLPIFVTAWAVSSMSLLRLLAVFVVSQTTTLLSGTWVLSGSLRLGAQRRTERRTATRRSSGGFVALNIVAALILGSTIGVMRASGGSSQPWPLLAVLGVFQAPALVAVDMPDQARASIFGASVPLWVMSLALVVCLLVGAIATARQRWKPRQRTRAFDLRVGAFMLALVTVLLCAVSARMPDEYVITQWWLSVLVVTLAPTWSGVSELSDVGARAVGVRRMLEPWVMRRSNAVFWSLLLLFVVESLLGALAPASTGEGLASGLFIAFLLIPSVLLMSTFARLMRPGRPAALALFLFSTLAMLLLAFLPDFLTYVPGFAQGEPGARLAQIAASVSPVRVLQSALAFVGPLASSTKLDEPAIPAWVTGPLLQSLALGLLLLLTRRRRQEAAPPATKAA